MGTISTASKTSRLEGRNLTVDRVILSIPDQLHKIQDDWAREMAQLVKVSVAETGDL